MASGVNDRLVPVRWASHTQSIKQAICHLTPAIPEQVLSRTTGSRRRNRQSARSAWALIDMSRCFGLSCSRREDFESYRQILRVHATHTRSVAVRKIDFQLEPQNVGIGRALRNIDRLLTVQFFCRRRLNGI